MTSTSPCIGVCFIDPAAKLCIGCGRTLPEIARWSRIGDDERRSIMATLAERMKTAGLEPPPR